MSDNSNESRQVDFKEGIRLVSCSDGLVIQVTDYHAKPLKVSWATLIELRRRAFDAEEAGLADDSGGTGNPGDSTETGGPGGTAEI